jgi:hypothetical protein
MPKIIPLKTRRFKYFLNDAKTVVIIESVITKACINLLICNCYVKVLCYFSISLEVNI